jgi:hypothetical protein
MSKLTLVILNISISSILMGCTFSTSKMISKNEIETRSLTEKSFDLNYSLFDSDRDDETYDLWQKLYLNIARNEYGKIEDPKEKHINIQLINKSTIFASLYHDDEFIDGIHLKGKIRGNYFIVKRNYRLIPFPPIIYIRNEVRTVIANSDSGDLILIQGVANEGWILFMAGGFNRVNQYRYTKTD